MQKSTGKILQTLYRRKLIVLLTTLLIAILVYGSFTFSNLLFNQSLDVNQIAEEINQKCKEDSSNRCYKTFLTSFAKVHTFNESKAVFDELQKINKKLVYCHTYAHAISVAEVEKDPENWLHVFSYVPDSECSYGYFHGVIEGKYRTDQDFNVDDNIIDSVCMDQMKSSSTQRGCTHAFGHVLLVQNEGQVLPSLEVCKKVNSKITESCYQGVFMENIQKENLSEHGISNREEWNNSYLTQQIAFCNTMQNSPQTECWRSLKPVIMSVASLHEYAIAICQSAPTYAAIRACSREVNGQYFIEMVTNGYQLSPDLCKPFIASNEDYNICIKDIINFVILTSYQLKSALHDNFCLRLNKEYIQSCQKTVQSYTNSSEREL